MAAEPVIVGFERVADGSACEFCQEVDGAYVSAADAMALHNFCGCGVEPVLEASLPRTPKREWEPSPPQLDADGKYRVFYGTDDAGAAKVLDDGVRGDLTLATSREEALRNGDTVVEIQLPRQDVQRYLQRNGGTLRNDIPSRYVTREGAAVHEHGELGAVLSGPEANFLDEAGATIRGRLDDAGIPTEKPLQQGTTFDEVYGRAQEQQRAFRELLDLGKGLSQRLRARELVEDDLAVFERKAGKLAAESDPTVVIPPLKERASALEKLTRKAGYEAKNLTDLNRASILVRDLADVPAVFNEMRAYVEARGWTLHELDNGFVGTGVNGYRDLAVLLRSPAGDVCEVQLHIGPMWEAKFRGGHGLYENLRTLQGLDRDLTAAEKKEVDDLVEEMRELYERAWDKAKAGS